LSLILLLLIATAVALVTQRLRISYVAGLVLAGLPITDLLSRRIGLDPFLVLNLFLPILIFEAAINTDISRLRSTFKPIALLAGPGSVFSCGDYCSSGKIWPGARLDSRLIGGSDSSKYRYCLDDCRL
jgi:CPA1 family monovalent cation:H+ antiporter